MKSWFGYKLYLQADVRYELPMHMLENELAERCFRHMRSGGGRNDWPLQPMLKACIARIVYQHPSVKSFRRELQRNPSLTFSWERICWRVDSN